MMKMRAAYAQTTGAQQKITTIQQLKEKKETGEGIKKVVYK